LRIVPHATLSIEAKRQQTTVLAPPQQTSQNI